MLRPRLRKPAARLLLFVGGVAGLFVMFACAPEASAPRRASTAADPLPHLTPAPNVQGDPERGRALFLDATIVQPSGCGTCHSVRGVPGASGIAGPNLTNISLRPTLAGDLIPNTPENMQRWIVDPSATKPGALMPKLGVTDAQARDLTAFLFSQPYNAPAR